MGAAPKIVKFTRWVVFGDNQGVLSCDLTSVITPWCQFLPPRACPLRLQGRDTKPWKPGEMWVEEVYKQFMITTVKTVFDHDVCMHA